MVRIILPTRRVLPTRIFPSICICQICPQNDKADKNEQNYSILEEKICIGFVSSVGLLNDQLYESSFGLALLMFSEGSQAHLKCPTKPKPRVAMESVNYRQGSFNCLHSTSIIPLTFGVNRFI